MKNLIARFVRDEQGQDLIEYALLAGFISLAVVTAVTNVGTSLNSLYDTVDQQVQDAGDGAAGS
jgi:pilus assembly protein Flp/PilA